MADESDTSDESLDAGSDKFDPLKALYSPKMRIEPTAPTYDNISKFEAMMKGINVLTKVCISRHVLAICQFLTSVHPRKPKSNKGINQSKY